MSLENETFETLLYERRDHVIVVTLNRPEQRNAISYAMWGRFLDILRDLDRDEAVRLLQLGFDNGQNHSSLIHIDPSFDELRGYAPYDNLMRPR